MSFLVNPFRFAAGGPTYASFQAHIATLATDGVIAWSDNMGGSTNRAYRTTAATETGSLRGSPWSTTGFADGSASRVVQHSLPSQAVFNAQIAAGREIFVRYVADGITFDVFALDRNGYASSALSDPEGFFKGTVTELLYWDGTGAQKMVPSTQTGPTPYSF